MSYVELSDLTAPKVHKGLGENLTQKTPVCVGVVLVPFNPNP